MLRDLKAKNDGGTTGGVHQHQMCAKISARILASRCEIATSEAVQKNAHLVGLGACCKKCVVPRNDRRRSSRETRPMYEEKRFRARARQLHLYVPGKVGGGKRRFPYHFHAYLAFRSPGLELATFSNTWPSSLGAFFSSCMRFAHFTTFF